MSGLWSVGLFAGAAVGVGLAMIIYVVLVPRRPALVSLLERASARPDVSYLPVPEVDLVSWRAKLTARFAGLLEQPWMPVPAKDLAVVEKSRSRFVVERASAALVGLLAVPLFAVVLWAIGAGIPPVIPAFVSVALAVGFWMAAGIQVKRSALARRREMKYALVAYLRLVALFRAAGEGSAASLELAAGISGSWSFRRIDRQVAAAVRSQHTVWQGLQDLADELEIEELSDLSSIAESGGVMGAQIGQTLLARANSLQHELLAKEQEEAAAMTNRMVFPKSLLGMVIALFVLFPPLYSLASGAVGG